MIFDKGAPVDDHIELDKDGQTIVDRGKDAWESLKRNETWEKWIAIGWALDTGQRAVMRRLNVNKPGGGAWGKIFGRWLAENGFDQIDKGVRSRLMSCMDNQAAIETWRATLSLTERLQLNHPNSVWRKYQATQRAPEKAAEPRTNAKDESIRELQEKLDAAQKRIDELVSGTDRLTANAVKLTQRTDAPLPQIGREPSSQLEWESDWSIPEAAPDEIAVKLFETDPVKAKAIALALRRLIDRKAKA
jgi:hypothetical protein